LSGVRCVSLCMEIHRVSAVLPQLLICHNPSSPVMDTAVYFKLYYSM
jgi:hypothetical protein